MTMSVKFRIKLLQEDNVHATQCAAVRCELYSMIVWSLSMTVTVFSKYRTSVYIKRITLFLETSSNSLDIYDAKKFKEQKWKRKYFRFCCGYKLNYKKNCVTEWLYSHVTMVTYYRGWYRIMLTAWITAVWPGKIPDITNTILNACKSIYKI